MANLTWLDVVVIGLVATLGFTLVSWWFSALMAGRGWTWQARNRPPKKAPPKGP
ncbi:MAG: hypothetical protein ACYDBQ_03720 [Thermoplasmatota archaeon]